ncbi:hypothetical protein [Tenacibaculum finnmarkense]|uniref:Uncharacterized protein n=1 Tax=Tenacibaculum finnmarkense genomovar ulcerans TaxID=2781388 RepID=A0A2I2MAW3_9FLAO|nr:hypothetical protein [Tenacibaculum finnmarkense]MBE7698683.1 hypothetical protein [Tenacibaculum finnmarkense genomovar ulcerans]SOU89606.1 hypothetical protein TNO010_430001 [Tenacibaculum finnmarkense genomovar ulcerans]
MKERVRLHELIEIEKTVQFQQIYFRKQVVSQSDNKCLVEAHHVAKIGKVEITDVSSEYHNQVVMRLEINGKETTFTEYMSVREFERWIKNFMIPLRELIYAWVKVNNI